MQTRTKPNTFFTMAQDALQKQGIQVTDTPDGVSQSSAQAVKHRRRKRWQPKNPLRDLRVHKGYTLEELANATGLSPSYLSRLESGSRRLNADIIQKLASILECSPADLLPFTNGPTSAQNVFPHGANVESLPVRSAGNQNAPVDLPVYEVTSQDGKLAFDFNQPKDWIVRNADFTGVTGAFALSFVTGDYSPRYTENDLLLAHPSKSLIAKCYVIVVASDGNVTLGRFDHWESAAVTSGNFGPVEANAEDILKIFDFHDKTVSRSFVRKEIKGVYRVVGTAERT